MDGSFQKLIGLICRESEMMKNDTNMTCQQQFWNRKSTLNFCVGMRVGGIGYYTFYREFEDRNWRILRNFSKFQTDTKILVLFWLCLYSFVFRSLRLK